MNAILPPLPVAGPLAVSGLLLAFSHWLPRRVPDVIGVVTALGVMAVCVAMAGQVGGPAGHPLVYWFGGWVPRGGQAIGIGFSVDQAGAWAGAFIGLLFAATLVFAWGYYDEVHAHFHVLMMLFMAGMVGFCLTHDLFNLFVWFEVMSIAGFALTGYALRSSALDGALNFTVVNAIGSYLILGGIGVIYTRVGALDFTGLARGIAGAPGDPLVMAAFALLATGLLIKAAQVPFHFWLADAHAVAPSPVSVVFSGAMVALGVFGLWRLIGEVFAPSAAVQHAVHGLLLGLGAASALLGGATALVQRHIKRLLAFSTISHVGLMLIGVALTSAGASSGMLVYLVGHGLVKAALFMLGGILLATCGGIDELGLRGAGRRIWPAGIAMACGGLLLAGLPVGLMHAGTERIEAAAEAAGRGWLWIVIVAAEALTGGAVLRVTGRVFLGLGPVSEQTGAPTEQEREKADRPLWLMLAPTALLLGLGAAGAAIGGLGARQAAGGGWRPVLAVGLALLIAGYGLMHRRLPALLAGAAGALNRLHGGVIGDYLAWLMVGLALFTIA